MFTYNDYLILFCFFIMYTIRLYFIDLFNYTFYRYDMIEWNYKLNNILNTNLLFEDGLVNINTFILLILSIYVGSFYVYGIFFLIIYFLSIEFIFILNDQRGKLIINSLTICLSFLFGIVINLILNKKKNESGLKDYDEYKSEILDNEEILN